MVWSTCFFLCCWHDSSVWFQQLRAKENLAKRQMLFVLNVWGNVRESLIPKDCQTQIGGCKFTNLI